MEESNKTKKIINQAIKLHLQGNISEAQKYYTYCINQGFDDPRVFSNYGIILQDLGKLKTAEIVTRKAIELNPNFAEAHSNLGIILKDFGKLEEAKSSLSKAIKLKPDYINAHYNLGSILSDLGKLKEAEISTKKAIDLNPTFANAHSNLAIILKDQGQLKEAEISARKAIELNTNFAEAHSNLGSILVDMGKLAEAEVSTRKAIILNPNMPITYCNLGLIFRDLGKLEDAEVSLLKAIELNPYFSTAHYLLSTLKSSSKNKLWQDQLFSENMLDNKLEKEKINIYFARANILHKKKNYKKSAEYLVLANNYIHDLNSFDHEIKLKRSQELLFESTQKIVNHKEHIKSPESIFIVGMYRSGSTLLESILSMNPSVSALGEIDILEKSFLASKQTSQKLDIAHLYWKKIKILKNKGNITTNKNLNNYQYTGIILNQIPNAKIIHCYRNPLDNILSIYRAHFTTAKKYSSSLVDCAKVYLEQDEIMTEYKKYFRSKIYDLNYDLLVSNPKQEINSLISWLGWQWSDLYLSPHLNTRSVSTASSVQVRYPINSKSLGGWKNYYQMLQPAIEILTKSKRYKDITS